MIRRPGTFERELRNQVSDDGYLQTVEIAADVMISDLIHALTSHNLTLRNVPGRGLRIVRFPTPGEET